MSAIPDFEIHEDDDGAVLSVQLRGTRYDERTGALVRTVADLTGSTVKLYMRQRGHAKNAIDGAACVIEDSVEGLVSYTFQPGDLARDGDYDASFVVEWADRRQTFPSPDLWYVRVTEALS